MKIEKVYMFKIEGNHDSTGMGINCPDPRENNPIPLYQCVGICCMFLQGTYKEPDSDKHFVACSWNKNKSVEENMGVAK